MSRWRACVVAAMVAAAVGAPAVGTPLLGLGFGAAAVVAALLLRDRVAPDAPWARAGSNDPAPVAPHGAAVGGSGGVVRALGRVEARELAKSPWFGAGVGLWLLMLVAFVLTIEDPGTTNWTTVFALMPFLAHPLVGVTIVAAHRCTTRAERDGVIELFESTPTTPAVRAAGVLAATWVPVATLAACFAIFLGLTAVVNPGDQKTLGPVVVEVSHLVAGLVLGVGGVALGVALGRWWRSGLVPVVAVAAVGFVSLRLGGGIPGEYHPRMLLSTFGTTLPEDAPPLTAGRAWLHVAWLVIITILTAAVAVHRIRDARPPLWGRPRNTERVRGFGRVRGAGVGRAS